MKRTKLINTIELKRLISHNFRTEYGIGENETDFGYILSEDKQAGDSET